MLRYPFFLLVCLILFFLPNVYGQLPIGVKKIVIDAGHGGHDVGCQGSKHNEKDIALSIALKLGKYIEEKIPDVEVLYTRKTDIFIPLDERAKIANEAHADLFICVHANAGVKTAIGTETYVMGLHKSESNLQVAQRENASILLEDNYQTKYEDFDPNSPESYIMLTLRQNAFLDQSLNFAAKIQDQFEKRVGRNNRGVKQAGFLVLHKTTMPSVLIETGFLSNKEEEKFLASELGQDYLSSAVYRAFKEYKSEIDEKKSIDKTVTKDIIKKSPTHNIRFKVQISSGVNSNKFAKKKYTELGPINHYKTGSVYKFIIGNETTLQDAIDLQSKARKSGFKDAFVVAFENEKRISVKEATRKIMP